MTKEAKISLATDATGFHNQYGTHFIVGFTKECEMDVYFRRTAESDDMKMSIGMEMSVDSYFYDVKGNLDMSASRKSSFKKTKVEVNYKGDKGEKGFITGLNAQ